MQCKLRFPLLQHMIYISTSSIFPAPARPSLADFDSFPARLALWGGAVPCPAPPHPIDFWPCSSPPHPVKKIASPSIPDLQWPDRKLCRWTTRRLLRLQPRKVRQQWMDQNREARTQGLEGATTARLNMKTDYF